MGAHNWTPIGYYDSDTGEEYQFKGTFNGDGHTISNLTVSGGDYRGLFGINGGTIQNVTLNNANVTGSDYVGGLVGRSSSTVTNCTFSGTVTATSNFACVGGLVGYNDYGGTVSDNTAISTLSGTFKGGIVGYNYGTVSGNKYYSNANAVGVSYGSIGTNTQLYALTLPGGVTVTSGAFATANGTTYAAGNITLAGKTGYTYSGTTTANITAATDLSNLGTATFDTANHYVLASDTNTLATADNVGNYPDLVQVYALTLQGVTVTGDTVVTVDGTTYAAGTVTVAAKTGYVYSGETTLNVAQDTTVSASLDTANHYVLANNTSTLATADNTTAYPDLIQVYALTVPTGVTVSGSLLTDGNTAYVTTGNVTFTGVKTGYVINDVNVTQDTTVTATLDTENHYVLADNTSTLATADNTTDYPNLVQVYELTLPSGVTASGDSVVTIEGTTYATGDVTLSAAEGYTLQNVKVDGKELTDNFTFTVGADATITADSVKFGNGGKSVEVGGTTGNFGEYDGLYSITASQQNSTLVGNNNNNAVILEGGGVNILTGGGGNDTFKFSAGGGIVTDYGIGSTKDSTGKTLSAPLGTDVIKLDGEVKGVYFDRAASSKKSATFTAIVTYDSTAVEGEDTQIIVLQNINKKPTKYSSDASKVVYQTNDVAAATLKIWDTSGSKQAVLSASKLKKLFKDDSELSDDLLKQVANLGKLNSIGDLNLPAVDQLNQTAQATFNGGDNG